MNIFGYRLPSVSLPDTAPTLESATKNISNLVSITSNFNPSTSLSSHSVVPLDTSGISVKNITITLGVGVIAYLGVKLFGHLTQKDAKHVENERSPVSLTPVDHEISSHTVEKRNTNEVALMKQVLLDFNNRPLRQQQSYFVIKHTLILMNEAFKDSERIHLDDPQDRQDLTTFLNAINSTCEADTFNFDRVDGEELRSENPQNGSMWGEFAKSLLKIETDDLEFKHSVHTFSVDRDPKAFLQNISGADFDIFISQQPDKAKKLVDNELNNVLYQHTDVKFNISSLFRILGDDIINSKSKLLKFIDLGRSQSSNFVNDIKELLTDKPAALIKVYDCIEPWTFDEKLRIAKNLLQIDPKQLAMNLTFLFQARDISENRDAFKALFEECTQRCDDKAIKDYLNCINMDLEHKKVLSMGFIPPTSSLHSVPKGHVNDGIFWEVIAEEPNREGKNTIFKLRPEYNTLYRQPYEKSSNKTAVINQKFIDNYPAVENLPQETDTRQYKRNFAELIEQNPILGLLGYKVENQGPSGIFIRLPDRDAIMSGWEALRNTDEYSHLPPLSIVSSIGIASAEEFLDRFIENDGLLAIGSEHVHDQMAHIMKRLVIIANNPNRYSEIMGAARDKITYYRDVVARARENGKDPNLTKIIQFSIGIMAEYYSTQQTEDQIIALHNSWESNDSEKFGSLPEIWLNPIENFEGWRKFLNELGIENHAEYSGERIYNFWKEISEEHKSGFH